MQYIYERLTDIDMKFDFSFYITHDFDVIEGILIQCFY